MRMKKSIFGGIVWILYVGILILAIVQNVSFFSSEIPQNMWMAEGLILGYILVALAGLLCAVRSISFRIQKKWMFVSTKFRILEVIGLIFLAALFIGVRVYLSMTGMPVLEENQYYTSAIVGGSYDKGSFSALSNGYIYILSVLFSFLGNKLVFGVYFQMILQGITFLLLYVTVKNVNGRVNAFAVTLALIIWNYFFDLIWDISPIHLLFFFIVFVMWYLTTVWKVISQGKRNWIFQSILLFGGSILTGAMCYLDMMGICVLVLGVTGLFFCRPRDEIKKVKGVMSTSLGYLAGSVVSFMAFLWIESIITKTGFYVTLSQFCSQRISEIFFQGYAIYPADHLELSVEMLLLASSWTVGFWLAKKDENILNILFMTGVLCCAGFVHGEMNYEQLLPSAWILIIITSVVSFCTNYEKMQMEQVKEQAVDTEVEEEPESEEDVAEEPESEEVEEKPELKKEVEEKPEVKEELKPETAIPKSFVPIPNPLPLPKQHVHKEMDYGLEVEEAQMHYDLEQIPEDDDYDLK